MTAAALLVTEASSAQLDAQARHARSLAATCASCHHAGAAQKRAVPALEGMPADAMLRSMQDFKAGTRAGTVMPQLARGYSDAQVAAIAAWYARSKP